MIFNELYLTKIWGQTSSKHTYKCYACAHANRVANCKVEPERKIEQKKMKQIELNPTFII